MTLGRAVEGTLNGELRKISSFLWDHQQFLFLPLHYRDDKCKTLMANLLIESNPPVTEKWKTSNVEIKDTLTDVSLGIKTYKIII